MRVVIAKTYFVLIVIEIFFIILHSCMAIHTYSHRRIYEDGLRDGLEQYLHYSSYLSLVLKLCYDVCCFIKKRGGFLLPLSIIVGGVVLGDYFIFRVNMANFHCFYHRQRGMSAPLWFWRNTNSADTN